MTEYKTIWSVSWCNKKEEEPTITLFDNEEAALNCFDYFRKNFKYIWIDGLPLYKHFIIK